VSHRPETRVVHAGAGPDRVTGAVVPPIHLATTFVRDEENQLVSPYLYSRYANPTRDALEGALAALEGGAAAAAFASGLAAATAVFQMLRPGDHVVLPEGVYSGVRSLVTTHVAAWGITSEFVDEGDAAAYAAAIARRPPALVWIETPSNPMWRVADIAAVSAAAHAAGARVVVDNTVATPLGQSPLALGADVVMHATTKGLGGHSDVLGGALVAREDDAWFARLREVVKLTGGVAAPFDCWLVLRGIRTLAVRTARQWANAQRIAEALAAHPSVSAVHYPGLPAHPQHALAARQMHGFGSMLSLEVAGGREAALRFVGRVRLWTRATSLGGCESLIEHRKTVEAPETPTPESLVRLSVGVEHVDDLLGDLVEALDA
jgi:cystathionine gamma-synthase